jgi:nitrogen-specific signal transduction histidine kinase
MDEIKTGFKEETAPEDRSCFERFVHDIRNPLTNISLAAEQIESALPDTKETLLLAQMIQRNAERIRQLIEEILRRVPGETSGN